MSIIARMRKQNAVYWARGESDEYGRFAYEAPVQIDCRWEDVSKEFRNEMGELWMSAATVYVDRVMTVGDKLMLGELESDTPLDPSGLASVFEIKKFDQLPNLRNTETLLTAYLT